MARFKVDYTKRLYHEHILPPINVITEELSKSPSIKYVTIEGEGFEKVTVCDRGRGLRACDITLIKNFIIHMKHEI